MTNGNALIVPAATNAPAEGLRGLKPLVDIPSPWTPWLWAAAVLLALAAAFLIRRLLRNRTATPEPVPTVPAHTRALDRLRDALRILREPEPFCVAVSDAVRTYLEDRFQLHAPDRTTEEFLAEIASSPVLGDDHRTALAEFLTACDLVKFARLEPSENELRRLHDTATRLVIETRLADPDTEGDPTESPRP